MAIPPTRMAPPTPPTTPPIMDFELEERPPPLPPLLPPCRSGEMVDVATPVVARTCWVVKTALARVPS